MGEAVFFRNLTTKGLTAVNSGERYFEGYLTVQVKDKQGEVTIVDELMKVLPVWIDRGAPISDTHSNRIIGKGINYSKVEYRDKDGEVYPAIKVTGKIHKNYELDNDIWQKIKSGEYKGLSFGGATKSDREPMRMKDGSIAYSLKDLEHYEVAVCRDPAVPLALITEYNTLAKAAVDGVNLGDGRMLIKCDKFGCFVDKNNKEAGLKAPEARNEALVYDDKTHDQPSETPLENQARVQKGKKPAEWHSAEWWKELYPPYDKLSEQEKEDYRVSRMSESQGLDVEEKETVREAEENSKKIQKGKDDDKYYAAHMDESEAVFRHATGQDKGVRDTIVAKPGTREENQQDKINSETGRALKGTAGMKQGHQENCEFCSAGKRDATIMVKPEDKQRQDSLATHQAHHTDTKNASEDWSNADGDRHSMYNQDTDEGGMGRHKQKGCKCGDPKCKDPKCKKHKREVGTGHGAEQNDAGEVGWSGSGSPYPKKKKAIITNIYSRLKSLNFMLKGYSDEFKEDKENWEQQQVPSRRKRKRRGKDAATITNILSRLKSLDFLLRKEPLLSNSWEAVRIDQKEQAEKKKKKRKKKGGLGGLHGALDYRDLDEKLDAAKKKKKKKSFLMRVKDGEFGGMNTGEVEWTEPRDTANSRMKRGKDVA